MNIITPTAHEVYVCVFCAEVSTYSICDTCLDYNLLLSEAMDDLDGTWLLSLVSAGYLTNAQAYEFAGAMHAADMGYEYDVDGLVKVGVISADVADYMLDGMDAVQATAATKAAA